MARAVGRLRWLPPCAVWLLALACDRSSGDGNGETKPLPAPIPGTPELPSGLEKPSEPETDAADAGTAEPEGPLSAFPKPPEHAGPWFVVTSPAAGVYSEPSFERSLKLGWVRSGGRLAVKAEVASKKGCAPGWYEVVGGGFICGNYGTTDLKSPDVKFAITAPNLEEVLPYVYASNRKHGTPLYKSVPSREQMLRYEPYLEEKSGETEGAEASAAKPRADAGSKSDAGSRPAPETVPASDLVRADVTSQATQPLSLDGSHLTLDPGMADAGIEVAPPEKPWWQQEDIKERLHEVKLEHLEADADEILAKRMVKGFYVAVDRTFRWNDRTWYKTTKGMVTPAGRFWQAAGSKFQGVVLEGEAKLPVAWGYGGRKQVASYKLEGSAPPANAKSYERHTAVFLSGREAEHGKTSYVETTDGTWLKKSQVRITEPGPLPKDLAPNERWIDVDLSSQTVVAFVGSRPVFATLISTGKSSKDKAKDHSTPTGEWRVREKHLTTTMDGDGTAAGDLPYSIEDVPYVMFFHKAYALHGAFWHGNYGVQMSHGCVNLSPLDAKWLFYFASPLLQSGFHGAWSRDERPGTRIVVHE